MSGLNLHLREVLLFQDYILAALVLETFHDLVGGNLLGVGFRDFFVFDGAEISRSKLSEAELLFLGRRVDGYGYVNETEADATFPNRTHGRATLTTLAALCQLAQHL